MASFWKQKTEGNSELISSYRLSLAITSYPQLADRVEAIMRFLPIPVPLGSVLDWIRSFLSSLVASIPPTTLAKHHGTALVDIAVYFDDPAAFYTERQVNLMAMAIAELPHLSTAY